jgi:uncharacterized tellurite resistance protein B-like protein
MPFSLSQIFKAKQAPSDGLTQTQREAIVDLLHLCMYADNLISLAETQVVTDVVDSFAWDTKTSFQSYETRSIAKAREAKESTDACESLYVSLRTRLDTPNSRTLAVKVCKQLLAADGVTGKEEALLAKVSAILG